jgi:hypothetical protein
VNAWEPSEMLIRACAAAFPIHGTDEDCVRECLRVVVASGELVPRPDRERITREGWMAELEDEGLVVRYEVIDAVRSDTRKDAP